MPNERLRAAIATAGLGLEDVAARVEVDPKTVERWITTGRLPHRSHRFVTAQLLGRDEAYLWPETVDDDRSRRASQAELVRLYPSRAAVPVGLWRSLVEDATVAVEILVYAGQFLVDSHPELPRLLTRKAAAGTAVRLLLGDPASEAVRRRGEEEGIGADLTARIRLSLSGLRPLLDGSGAAVRLHDTTLYCSTYRFDDDLFVNTHVLGAPAAHAPVLHLRRAPGGRLFDLYLQSFERVWSAARPVDLTREAATMAG